MRLNEVTFSDARPVDGYGPGFFRIGGEAFEGAVIAGPTGTHGWGGLEGEAALLALKGQVDVIFVGTGAEPAHLPRGLRAALEA
ncbi:MAG TPA: hypothetical protein DEA05_00605, partial [Rhodobacteraceae bacterium]|nr:hypothetical protein [Paracoccaceae bacterium]